ncbi:MAG TPA: hypothetical protein VIL64_05620, partial [Solirubrobacteraceae bacterium]
EPRRDLRLAITRVVNVVNANDDVLLLAGRLGGAEERLPPEWEPYVRRFVRACEQRIRRDQERGVAANDIDAAIAARALCAMVERHLVLDVIRGGLDANDSIYTLSELWYRGVYSLPAAA